MTTDETLEAIRTYLPKYLTPELVEKLIINIKEEYPSSTNPEILYTKIDTKFYYQGDAIVDLPYAVYNLGKYETSYLKGIIASNTCDISLDNQRIEPIDVQFFVIVELEEYINQLRKSGALESQITSFTNSIKSNHVSNIFYLPELKFEGTKIFKESFVRFDKTVSFPISLLEGKTYNKKYAPNGDRLFSLSNYGFYLFLIKLSVHICRIKEGVFRNN